MVLNDRVSGELVSGATEIFCRQIKLPGLVIRPAKAVEIGTVVWLDLERSLHQIDRFVETLASLRQHVAQIVEGGRMIRLVRDDLTECGFRFDRTFLLVVDRTELEG